VIDADGENVQGSGGDTDATSDDADGGDGGDAVAVGGIAVAGNIGFQDVDNDAADVTTTGLGDLGLVQDDEVSLSQGANTAEGGAATGTGGAGGDADTGNDQDTNGNALVTASGDNVQAFGGDTTADSGDADGGVGGDGVS